MTQPMLFDLPEPVERCATCDTPRPAGHVGMYVEPVSGECGPCNHRTVGVILREYLTTRGRLARSPVGRAALARHYRDDERLTGAGGRR